jgi:hypothetical protein
LSGHYLTTKPKEKDEKSPTKKKTKKFQKYQTTKKSSRLLSFKPYSLSLSLSFLVYKYIIQNGGRCKNKKVLTKIKYKRRLKKKSKRGGR